MNSEEMDFFMRGKCVSVELCLSFDYIGNEGLYEDNLIPKIRVCVCVCQQEEDLHIHACVSLKT